MSVRPNTITSKGGSVEEVSTDDDSNGFLEIDDLSEDDEKVDEKEDQDIEFEGDEPTGGEETERVYLEKEDEFIRKLIDPKMPTEEEIKIHELRGHVDFRNWCPICLQA